MTREQIAAAFNEWLRRYIADPAAFDAEFKVVADFLADRAAGREPSYGEVCADLLARINADLDQ